MSKIRTTHFKVEGMHCAGCAAGIEKGLNRADGVVRANVNFALGTATVDFDSAEINEKKIIDKVGELGYTARPEQLDFTLDKEHESARRHFLAALILTVPIAVLSMSSMLLDRPLMVPKYNGLVLMVMTALVMFVAGRSIFVDAFRQTIRFRANMNSLIALGTLAAFLYSIYILIDFWIIHSQTIRYFYFETSAMIVTLILLGRYLESRARGRARDAIGALLRLRPEKATVIADDKEELVDVGSLKKDMKIFVKPGEKIPADGAIIEGEPDINEAMITGEAVPVDKKVGDEVIGGSINGNTAFTFRVTGAGEDTFLAGIIRLVTETQTRKAPVQRLADIIAGVFVPVVLFLAAATLVLWYLVEPGSVMVFKAPVAVLIIACPCALGLATPTAILAGTGRAARRGIFIRGGDILESTVKADHVIFDKTGTLTRGEFSVFAITAADEETESKLLRMAASAESGSSHPLAEAIVFKAREFEIETFKPEDVVEYPGFGVKADVDGQVVVVGNAATMKKEKVEIAEFIKAAEEEMDAGRTVVYVAVNGHGLGFLSLADTLKEEAVEVIAEIQNSGREVVMLTGDNYKTARGVARALGIERFEATVKPDQKAVIVETYRRADYKVIMVGDGINDAPALAAADIGVALGSGTDVAMESADIILVRDDLRSMVEAMEISRLTFRTIKQNLFWAFFYNIISIPLAAGLFYTLFGWGLSPVIAAGTMAFSSLFVVTNSVRLLQVKTSSE